MSYGAGEWEIPFCPLFLLQLHNLRRVLGNLNNGANNVMMNPIKLIFASLFALLAGCGESADLKNPAKDSKHTAEYTKSVSSLLPTTSAEFVAGLAPNQRPEGTPVIQEFTPSADWRTQSLTGVSEPIPASLDFIDSQGAWYTPFNQPGMPGYYDLRNLHHKDRNSNNASQ
jgi:hypothetical protein